MKTDKEALRSFFKALPVYTPAFDETIDAIVNDIGDAREIKKGQIVQELSPENKDFWFLKDGFLKEMYRNTYVKEDSLFNLIPPDSIFVNEDTLLLNKRPQHYFVAYTDARILQFKLESYERILKKYPLVQLLYIAGTAEIQKNRRARLTMLRMSKTLDRVKWVREFRPELYRYMDRITLAQYIGVSRASLYRAFEKTDKYQF